MWLGSEAGWCEGKCTIIVGMDGGLRSVCVAGESDVRKLRQVWLLLYYNYWFLCCKEVFHDIQSWCHSTNH